MILKKNSKGYRVIHGIDGLDIRIERADDRFVIIVEDSKIIWKGLFDTVQEAENILYILRNTGTLRTLVYFL